MIVITYVDRVDGPIFKKTKVVLSVGWPLQIGDVLIEGPEGLRRYFHRLGIKNWRMEEIQLQNFETRKVLGQAHAIASELIFQGFMNVSVTPERSLVILLFTDFDLTVHEIQLSLDGYTLLSACALPGKVKDLVSNCYTELK